MRSFEIFARAAGLKGQQSLKDHFLSKGGKQLQDIYFLLPEAVEQPNLNRDATPYDDCVSLLKKYFKKKTSRMYEKYVLRQIRQGQTEDFQSFLKRIREQVNNCEFDTQARVDEEILDQIVVGTVLDNLRADLLKTELSLSQAIEKAIMMEGVTAQMKVFGETGLNVHKIEQSDANRDMNPRRFVDFVCVSQVDALD